MYEEEFLRRVNVHLQNRKVYELHTKIYFTINPSERHKELCSFFSISISISNYISQISITITIEFNNLIYSIRTI